MLVVDWLLVTGLAGAGIFVFITPLLALFLFIASNLLLILN